MTKDTEGQTRRGLLRGAAATMFTPAVVQAAPAARYRRYNVMSPEGQRMLRSYARGVAAMLKLPADHPHNWFRNAFVHILDCPHGNWWFYVWHRGYIGHVERTIRKLSGDPAFALPYWDWTATPRIPDGMFDGVLTPTDAAYAPVTRDLPTFTRALKPVLERYFAGLSPAQRTQLHLRGYDDCDLLWADVTGGNTPANAAFAPTGHARYLSPRDPALDPKTAYDVSASIVRGGLAATVFNDPNTTISFTSSRTPSHNTPPGAAPHFSTLEGLPHNKVHNCIGGVGPLDPGPYGNMTNFLSPVDPIFFLHHANMDRLWDVWQRRQQRLGRPWLPTGSDLAVLSDDPFLFFFDEAGKQVTAKAGDFLDTATFGYDYQPGFGEDAATTPVLRGRAPPASYPAAPAGGRWSARVPAADLARHLAEEGPATLTAEITIARPQGATDPREFDVLVNAPADLQKVDADSPYYAGTIAFFGPVMARMPGMVGATAAGGEGQAVFAVPLPRSRPVLLGASPGGEAGAAVSIRVVPSAGTSPVVPNVRAVRIHRR